MRVSPLCEPECPGPALRTDTHDRTHAPRKASPRRLMSRKSAPRNDVGSTNSWQAKVLSEPVRQHEP
eukprot:6234498-Pyramimonas_sp.AAC.1